MTKYIEAGNKPKDREMLSDCCGVPFNEDYGICPSCKEHCEISDFEEDEDSFEECDKCDRPDACADFGCAIRQGIKKDTEII